MRSNNAERTLRPLWVISGQTTLGQNLTLSALVQKRTNAGAAGMRSAKEVQAHGARG